MKVRRLALWHLPLHQQSRWQKCCTRNVIWVRIQGRLHRIEGQCLFIAKLSTSWQVKLKWASLKPDYYGLKGTTTNSRKSSEIVDFKGVHHQPNDMLICKMIWTHMIEDQCLFLTKIGTNKHWSSTLKIQNCFRDEPITV